MAGADAPDDLVPFDERHAATVSGWAPTAAEVLSWCGRAEAPVPAATVAGWSDSPDVRAFLWLSDGAPAAYGELWLDEDEREVELARLLVDPRRRGRGLGRALTEGLVTVARRDHPGLSAVFLRVLPDNLAAHRAYLAAGLRFADAETEAEWNRGQPREYRWMVLPEDN